MHSRFKAVLLAFVMSLAISGSAAATAQAAEFHGGEAHAIVSGSQSTNHVFSAGGGFSPVTCTTVTFAGTTGAETETELTVTPHYTNCSDTLGRTVDVNVNSCKYRLHATAKISPTTFSGDVDIVCDPGQSIQVAVTPSGIFKECKVSIGPQNGIGPVTFHNIAVGDIGVDWNAGNVVSTTAGGLFNCGIANGVNVAGEYSGAAVFAGTDTAANPVNIFVE